MKKKLQILITCFMFIGAFVYGQQYSDTLSFGKLDSEADLDGYPEFPFYIESNTSEPLEQVFTFTAGSPGSTKDVNVEVKVVFQGNKISRETGEVLDSTVYLYLRENRYLCLSGWSSETAPGVLNGDYRQFNDDEMLTMTFSVVNNQPPNELYPPVQMGMFGIGCWANALSHTDVLLNGKKVGVWIANSTGGSRLVSDIVSDPATMEPIKIVIRQGDVLQLKGITNPRTYVRPVGFAMVMEATVPSTALNLTAEGGTAAITELNGSLRILGQVLPENASDKRIVWSVADQGTGATISSGGILQANPRQSGNGTVTVTGSLSNGSVISTIDVLISGQTDVPVNSISIYTNHNDTIRENGGTMQMHANVLPEIAANKEILWSVIDNGTGATINPEGLLQANPRNEGNGTVKVVATAADGSGVKDTLDIVIMNQETNFVEVITILYPGDFPEITENNGTLQLTVEIVPENASVKSVTWSVDDKGTGATIDQNGLLRASGTNEGNGMVTVTATANDGSGVKSTLDVMIIQQVTSVNQNDANKLVVVYPNPLWDGQKLNVTVSESAGILQSVSIHQLNGQEIARYIDFSGKTNHFEVPIAETPGLYLLKVITTEGTYVQRVVKN
jgi:hypothetical protein